MTWWAGNWPSRLVVSHQTSRGLWDYTHHPNTNLSAHHANPKSLRFATIESPSSSFLTPLSAAAVIEALLSHRRSEISRPLPPPPWGKTCGMGAGRKLKTHRRNQRWADKAYKKSHFGNEWKKPFAGSSHAKGIVLEKIGIEAKQPNSAICKCARVQLVKNGKKIAAFVPNDGCLNFIKENVCVSFF
ncbi:Os10g0350450 [Oryza sativa Japonica Group]|uniref:Os10g0350450 protein n=1 Tax=Oryza sativa subsp. japonica TaxID=39947 RepID=A0A0P0XT53_ORYSJ|nr:Os10g0350450 [Oryza sativa Japonica Group]